MSKKLFYYGSTASFVNDYSWHGDGINKYAYKSVANFRSADTKGFIGGWIKTTSFGVLAIWASSDEATTSHSFRVLLNNGKIRFAITSTGVNNVIDSNTSTLLTGTWRHFLVGSTGAAYKMYIDGVDDGFTIAAGSNNGKWFSSCLNRDNITVGANRTTSAATYFNGNIANCGVGTDDPTTAGLVTNIYNLKMGDLRSVATIVGAWNFPGGQADYPTYNDYSGGANNLTMQNGIATDIQADVPT